MKEVYYKGIKTLMVMTIPAIKKGTPPSYSERGKRQYAENMCYIGIPFSKIVPIKEIEYRDPNEKKSNS
jgi:hypothetical protein